MHSVYLLTYLFLSASTGAQVGQGINNVMVTEGGERQCKSIARQLTDYEIKVTGKDVVMEYTCRPLSSVPMVPSRKL